MNKLKEVREQNGITLKQVAKYLKVNVKIVEEIENGKRKAPEEFINELCYLYNNNFFNDEKVSKIKNAALNMTFLNDEK